MRVPAMIGSPPQRFGSRTISTIGRLASSMGPPSALDAQSCLHDTLLLRQKATPRPTLLGYLLSGTAKPLLYPQMAPSFFLAWAFKQATLHWGGLPLYRALRP